MCKRDVIGAIKNKNALLLSRPFYERIHDGLMAGINKQMWKYVFIESIYATDIVMKPNEIIALLRLKTRGDR